MAVSVTLATNNIMENKITTNSISLSSVIFIILLLCKIFNVGVVGDWSWWIITAPLWIPVLLAILIIIILAVILKDNVS